MRIALAQLNPIVGDIAGNLELARTALAEAADADLLVFPELFMCGYPPEDLVLNGGFQADVRAAVEALAAQTGSSGPAIGMGTPWVVDAVLHNSVAILDDGKVQAVTHKVDLPNYGVFDEKRVFTPGPMPGPIGVRGVRIGFPICEDIWQPDVCECLEETGAELLIAPNGSPFSWQKQAVREQIAVARVTENELPLIYLNQVGGQDELVFDGASFALHADRTLALQLPAFDAKTVRTTWEKN
ncbi:MAG: nitrilase-related carbon-nitrogen hydrolase, partial [Pseudomonadota bacterium]